MVIHRFWAPQPISMIVEPYKSSLSDYFPCLGILVIPSQGLPFQASHRPSSQVAVMAGLMMALSRRLSISLKVSDCFARHPDNEREAHGIEPQIRCIADNPAAKV